MKELSIIRNLVIKFITDFLNKDLKTLPTAS